MSVLVVLAMTLIFQRTDGDGDRFAMYQGACVQGPIIAFWKNQLVLNLREGEDYPPGCSRKGREK